jgi:RNA polymerase sigma-70 factor (ECF subfamily)
MNGGDHTLWEKVRKEDDSRAFQQIFEKYFDNLFQLAFHKTKSQDLAQDLVQETFINLWKYRKGIKRLENVGNYLATMLKYQFFKEIKNQPIWVNQQEVANLESFHKTESNGFSLMEFEELYELIKTHIAMLPPKTRQLFLINRFENKSVKELALQFGISESTVRTHLNNASNQLKPQIENHLLIIAMFLATMN